MTPFLLQVAQHYHPAPEISRMSFIFPNKRAVGFFLKYLGDLSAAQRRPIIAPACITINDFFARLGGLRPADRMAAMLTLYDCYKALKPDAEPLDEFIFWGGVILSIFKNVAEYRQLQDSLDYLTSEQEEALRHFLGQFRDSGEYKERFRRIWDILLPLYHSFNEALAAEGMATEGAIYRSIAKSLDSVAVVDLLGEGFPDVGRFVFVGLNALNECEKRVMRRMRDAGVAEFCWDFSSEEILRKCPWSICMGENIRTEKAAIAAISVVDQEPQRNSLGLPEGVPRSRSRRRRCLRAGVCPGTERRLQLSRLCLCGGDRR